MLTNDDRQSILSEFPDIKLCYEKIIHKKVFEFDYALLIPDGEKKFAWFTIYNDNYICVLIDANKNKCKIMNACFSKNLCYGNTILYGTFFYHRNNPFFSIEDIYIYNNKHISRENWKCKLQNISSILKNDIKQISYNNSFIVFGLPVMFDDPDTISLKNIKYKITSIHYKKNNTNSSFVLDIDKYFTKTVEQVIPVKEAETEVEVENNKNNSKIIFEIKPDLQNDIYHLYINNGQYYGIACIPDYKTSVLMNSLFRNIKENNNLDSLEESDDDEEFENDDIYKFIKIKHPIKMRCLYNKRFKKWTPINRVNDNSILSSIKEIEQYSKQFQNHKKY